MIRASFFSRKDDVYPQYKDFGTFEDLAASIKEFLVVGASQADKSRTPCICPAEFLPEKTRSQKNTLRVHFGMLDFDGLTEAQVEQVLDRIGEVSWFFYTTHGHHEAQKRGLWKFRLGFPFSRPVSSEEWPGMSGRLRQLFMGLPDPKCVDSSRMYFLPCVPSTEALKEAIFEFAGGGAFDVESFLRMEAAAAVPSPAKIRKIGKGDLEGLGGRLSRRKNETLKKTGRALLAIAKGEAFAEVGERDEMMHLAACHIAETWPDLDPASVHTLLEPSIQKMLAADPEAPDLAAFVSKLDRARQRAAEEEVRKKKEEDDAIAIRIRAAFGGRRDWPYSEEELNGYAQDAEVSREAFGKRWILEQGEHYYFFFDGQYLPNSVSRSSLWLAAEKFLAPACSAGVRLRTVTTEGNPRRLTPEELVERYGSHFKAVEMDFTAQRSLYDMRRDVLVEAPCPLRPLEPERSEEVGAWLEMLAGENTEKLLDWIATVSDLKEPNAALYLSGASGVGKTLLAEGLARLWTLDGPTPMDSLSGSFNDDATRCPLILADEKVPDQIMRGDGTSWLRQLIQGRSITLKRKFKPAATIRGSIRVIFTANNDTLLHTRVMLTPEDAEAVASRILHVPVDHLGRQALEILREDSPEILEGFVKKDIIAKHALWLKATRKIARGKRFLVEGGSSSLERALLTSSDISGQVMEWAAGFLTNERSAVEKTNDLLARVDQRRLLINVKALSRHWTAVIKTNETPPLQALARALESVSEKKTVRLPVGGQLVEYRVLKLDVLYDWTARHAVVTREQIDAALSEDTKAPGGPARRDREPGCDDEAPF